MKQDLTKPKLLSVLVWLYVMCSASEFFFSWTRKGVKILLCKKMCFWSKINIFSTVPNLIMSWQTFVYSTLLTDEFCKVVFDPFSKLTTTLMSSLRFRIFAFISFSHFFMPEPIWIKYRIKEFCSNFKKLDYIKQALSFESCLWDTCYWTGPHPSPSFRWASTRA